jgi:hypothetical protein
MTGLDADDPPFPAESFQGLQKISAGFQKFPKTIHFFQICAKNFTGKPLLIRALRPKFAC